MTEENESGEQMDLIEVGPEHSEEIATLAKQYMKHRDARLKALAKETEKKQELIGLIKEENLQPQEDGKIRFRCDGFIVSLTPTEFSLKVKELDE